MKGEFSGDVYGLGEAAAWANIDSPLGVEHD
jgi:hypothetical protein